jgi:hypothetical protein
VGRFTAGILPTGLTCGSRTVISLRSQAVVSHLFLQALFGGI